VVPTKSHTTTLRIVTFKIRSTAQADLEVFIKTLHAEFGRYPPTAEDDGGGVFWSAMEMDRNLFALTEDDRPVGTLAAYGFELTVPGGTQVPTTGITNVGVLPSHRRQGVMTALMRHQINTLRALGECVSVLLATEATIYRRTGFGPATFGRRLTVTSHRAEYASPRSGAPVDESGGSIDVLPRGDCVEVLEEVYDRYRRLQPGSLDRPHRFWALGAGEAPVAREPRYIAIHRDSDGLAEGYASYSIDAGTLYVDETITVNDSARTALDRLLLSHDLVTQVIFKETPSDHPLRWQLNDYEAPESSGDEVWLWLRVLDVAKALSLRGWSCDGHLVLHVNDPFLGESGRYALTVRDGRAQCTTTDEEPDLTLDVSDLGSLYLGAVSPTFLVRAGHIAARDAEAVQRADSLFRSDRAPFCCHSF
jgi:predicted acetyltransferase